MTWITEPWHDHLHRLEGPPHVQLSFDSWSLFIVALLYCRPVLDSRVGPGRHVVAVKTPEESTSSGPHQLPIHLPLSRLR